MSCLTNAFPQVNDTTSAPVSASGDVRDAILSIGRESKSASSDSEHDLPRMRASSLATSSLSLAVALIAVIIWYIWRWTT
jgi:hypothetical protein